MSLILIVSLICVFGNTAIFEDIHFN